MTFWQEMKKPYNAFTTMLAVVSLAVGVWLFFLGQEKRDPYYVVSDPVQIFDSGSSLPSIKVNDKQNNPIHDNIFLTEITLWNAGERPIEPSDIRIPITISLDKAKQIVDFVVVEQTQPEVLGFTARASSKHSNTLDVSFKHFDPNLGAKVKVVYTGSNDPGVVIRGSILGAKFNNGTSLARKYFSNTIATFLAALMGAALAEIVKSIEKRVVSGDISAKRRRLTKILMYAAMLLVLLLCLKIFFAYKAAPI